MKRNETKAREIALQFLFQFDRRGDEVFAYLDDFLNKSTKIPSVKKYARILIEGCKTALDEIDTLIKSSLKNWDLKRVSPVDRTIIRIACYEMEILKSVPKAVAINEAVELAKKYSTSSSGAFVNGVLDQISSCKQFNLSKKS